MLTKERFIQILENYKDGFGMAEYIWDFIKPYLRSKEDELNQQENNILRDAVEELEMDLANIQEDVDEYKIRVQELVDKLDEYNYNEEEDGCHLIDQAKKEQDRLRKK